MIDIVKAVRIVDALLISLGMVKAAELAAEAYMWIEKKIKGKRK